MCVCVCECVYSYSCVCLCGEIVYYLLGLLHDVCFFLCVLWLYCISKCIHPRVYCTLTSSTSYFQRSTARNLIWETRLIDRRTGVLTGILLTMSRVDWYVVAGISKDRSTFSFRVVQSTRRNTPQLRCLHTTIT
jgi:hypothetical protein